MTEDERLEFQIPAFGFEHPDGRTETHADTHALGVRATRERTPRAPAGYLRRLPPPITAINMQYGLENNARSR